MTAPDALLTDLRAALDEAANMASEADGVRIREAVLRNMSTYTADAVYASQMNPGRMLRLIAAERETLDDIEAVLPERLVGHWTDCWEVHADCFAARVLYGMARVWLTDDQLRAHGIDR